MMSFKQEVYRYYLDLSLAKIDAIRQELTLLQESIAQETKSTAGDKYETSRAMIHIEQDRCNRQLSEAQALHAALRQIDPMIVSAYVAKGSLVFTDKGCFLISAALGKAVIDGRTCFALSPLSPLGHAFMGHCAGDEVRINGKIYLIEALC